MSSDARAKKTLAVLGLDGMPWSYLDKLVERGVIAYTKHLLQRSLKATLEAYPPATLPSWSSIMTGVNPGKHGIFGFFRYDKKTWRQRMYNALDLKHPRLHEMLSFLGYKSIVFNPIPDYPLIPVRNAEIISNLFFTPRPLSHPPGVHEKYFGTESLMDYTTSVTCGILEDYRDLVELYRGAVEKAVAKQATLLWVTLNAPDVLFHKCPQILSQDKLTREEERLFKGVDKMIRTLDQSCDSIIIVSDHGFSRYDWLVSVNDILVRHKLATTSNKPAFKDITDYRTEAGGVRLDQLKRVRVPAGLYKLVKSTGLKHIFKLAMRIYQKTTGKKVVVSTSLWVDARGSVAVMPVHHAFGVYVRERGRVKEVLDLLRSYEGVLACLTPDEAYRGPYVDEAPDVIVFPRFDEGYWVTENIIGSVATKGEYYAHHPAGVLVIKDEELSQPGGGSKKLVLPNYSVATLALRLLGLPLPRSRDYTEGPGANGGLEYDYLPKWRLLMRVRRPRLGV